MAPAPSPRTVPARVVSPSKITAWLDCDHVLTLTHEVEDGLRPAPSGGMGPFAQLLAAKGLQHEQACLADYERRGLRVRHVPQRHERESFTAWVARIGPQLDDAWDVLYQVPLVHEGVRGIADFLVRTVDDAGGVTWEPVDAKLARQEAKPGHVLQLCFYAEAIEAVTGQRPAQVHLWLGSGAVETLAVGDFAAYWRRLRTQLRAVLDAPAGGVPTVPEPCDHCAFCSFAGVCEDRWRRQDSLIYVAGLTARDRNDLAAADVETLAGLARHTTPVNTLTPRRQDQFVTQASLQLTARETGTPHPPHRLIEPGDEPTWGRGFTQLPAPDDGDVFLDFEGHPFWRADAGLFFLYGLIERDDDGQWRYREWWAHSPAEEETAARAVIEHLDARRAAHPGMHVYHYNHTERSSLERLAATHGVGEVALARLVDTGAFVDLLLVARNAVQVGTETYGLKDLERLTDYQRGHDVDAGAGAVLEYEAFLADGDEAALRRIAAYNEDDVRATRALRDWLVAHRPADLPWRAAELEPDGEIPELDEVVSRLHAHGPGTVEHLLGEVLGYWRREWSAHLMPLRARCAGATEDLLDDPDALAGLVCQGQVERLGRNGKPITPGLRFTLPEQDTGAFTGADQVVFTTPEGRTGYSSVAQLDAAAGVVELLWSESAAELDYVPQQVVRNDWVPPNPKPAALNELAAAVLDGAAPNPVAMALLRRDLPAFIPGGGPTGGRFSDDLDEMLGWVTQLDGSLVAIQGPPGTGKTFRGAHLVRTLLEAGLRVGITAMSHGAIDNLLDAVTRVVDPAELHAVKKGGRALDLAGVTQVSSSRAAAHPKHTLVAGTTWLFAGRDLQANPVDVLIVDEAGQLALADALAACRSSRSLVLLGDPLQLPQVAQAVHPDGSGASVLEHLLGDDVTMPAERGVFLAETRRMHPDVAAFISDEIYQGRLTTHPSCAVQSTDLGTGLRWLPVDHGGCTTEAPEEADAVATEIARLLDASWTDQHGVRAPIEACDILVVAPYNDQVDLLRARLDADPTTAGIAVGTVDKFQGREAAVVFFTMTSSSAADMTRGAEFLFSRNRLNVAVSRARCLAYLVCTEELLNSRGRDVEEMRLISTLCAFVEAAS